MVVDSVMDSGLSSAVLVAAMARSTPLLKSNPGCRPRRGAGARRTARRTASLAVAGARSLDIVRGRVARAGLATRVGM